MTYVIIADNGESYSDHCHSCFLSCQTLEEATKVVYLLRHWQSRRPVEDFYVGNTYAWDEKKYDAHQEQLEAWEKEWPLKVEKPGEAGDRQSIYEWIEVPEWAE